MKACERCHEHHVDDHTVCLEIQVKKLRSVLEAVAPKVDRGTQRFILAALGETASQFNLKAHSEKDSVK